MKRQTVITSVAVLLLCLTTTCGRKGPIEADKTPPTIVATTPALGSSNVPPNTSINVTFSKPVDEKTIQFVLVSAATGTIPCTMNYSGATATFIPSSPLAYSAQYFATVKAGVTDQTGNVMSSDYPWSFTTGVAPDTTPPSVSSTTPANQATNVYPNSLSVTFSEPVDEKTISFVLSAGATTIPCTMSYSGTTAIFIPPDRLAYNTQFTATVKAGVMDLAKNAMPSDYNWTFTTGSAPDTTPPSIVFKTPAMGATGVDVNAKISVTFSEPVDEKTIVFTLASANTGSTVPCTMLYSGMTATFTLPPTGLMYGASYLATVSAGVLDLAVPANAMPSDYEWSFTTEINPDYTITTTASTGGSINPSGPVAVNAGAAQAFTITPAVGYHIAGVTVDDVSVGAVPTYTFTNVTANHTISASFAINTYTVTPSVSGGNGSISPNTPQTVNYNGTATFTMNPAAGYRAVMGGTCGGTLSGDGLSYTTGLVTADCTVTASFSLNTYAVTPTVIAGSGSFSPSAPQIVSYGSTTSFTVTPAAGYSIASVTGCGGSLVGNVYTTAAITDACTVSASFAINTYTIMATAGLGGSITPSGQVSVNYGADQSFAIQPAPGYYISAMTVDGNPVASSPTYTFTNVTTNHTIQASFASITHIITASAGTGGTIDPSGLVLVNDGASKSFTVTPAMGYHIDTIGGTCGGTLVGNTYTTNAVTADCTVVANFAINAITTYTISATAGSGGSINPSGSVSVNSGADQTFAITPDIGYQVSDVQVDGSSVGAVTSYPFTNVTANHTISASFAVNTTTYTVTPSSDNNGSIDPSTPQTATANGTVIFTLTPVTAGYHIVTPVGGTCGGTLSVDTTTGVGTYTTNAITADCTVAASFAQNLYTLTVSTKGPGSVTSDPVGINCSTSSTACSASYAVGATVSLTAAPNGPNNVFKGWSGDCSGTSYTIPVLMDSDKTCTATFGNK